MKTLFVIRNQNDHYLGKQHDWVDGHHRPALFRTEHRDVAINELFETNIRDFDLRGEIVPVEVDKHGYPAVEVLNPISTEAEIPGDQPVLESATEDTVEASLNESNSDQERPSGT